MPATPTPNLQPFLPSRPSGIVFIALNALRVLSIVALLLVFSSNIVTMANDIKAIKATSSPAAGEEEWECEYIEYSTVPDQTGGAFWSVLNRLFIIFECLVLVLSEIGVPRRIFETFIPILGPGHGLGCLGVFECLIAASVLSHYCDLFPQVSAWLLFIVGCLNMVAGIVWRHRSKEKRLVFSWENVSSLTPQTRMAHTAWNMASSARSAHSAHSAQPGRGASGHKAKQSEAAFETHSLSSRDGDGADQKERGFAAVPLGRNHTSNSDSHGQGPLLPSGVGQSLSDRFAGVGKGLGIGAFGLGFGKRAEERSGVKISRPVESLPRYAH